MSTLKAVNVSHPSAASPNLVLASSGSAAFAGAVTATSVTGGGLDLITPTSIAYSGGSASSSNGTTTFSAVSSLSLNGVFTSAYTNYRMLLRVNGTTATADASLLFRVRSNGTDFSGATDYYTMETINDNGTLSGYKYASSAISFGAISQYGNRYYGIYDILNPQTGGPVGVSGGESYTLNSGSNRYIAMGATILNVGSMDGLTIYLSSYAMTGTVRVYGYKGT